MGSGRRWAALAVTVVAAATPSQVSAQETALKGGFTVSRLQGSGAGYWDGNLAATTFGGHVRFRFGPIGLQPEVQVVTKGATAGTPAQQREDEQLRLEYIEIPVLLVVPIRIGDLEPYAFAGPSVMLESRCRWVERQQGLRSTFSCEPGPSPEVFTRRSIDFGIVAGGGAAYPVGNGRVLIEARHSWGLRDIHTGPGDLQAYNRTFMVQVGYALGWEPGRD
jgi:hypothetical protein